MNYIPTDKDLIAMYYVDKAPECSNLESACMEIAKESSIGTWTKISTLSPEIAENLKPAAFYIDEVNHIVNHSQGFSNSRSSIRRNLFRDLFQ